MTTRRTFLQAGVAVACACVQPASAATLQDRFPRFQPAYLPEKA